MNGDLPPSSSDSRLPEPAVARRMSLPTSVEPVKAILSTPACADQRRPGRAVAGDDVDHARRQPRLAQISAKASAVSGVNSAGFSTTVLPQASAGAIFQASISSGKFHGMICPQTPTGPRAGKLAGDQLGPAGVMVEMARDERNVDVARLADRLAVVEALQHGEEALALLE